MKEWHCVLYGQVYGPFPEEKLREMTRQGAVWREGWLFPATRRRRFCAFVLDVLILVSFCVIFMAAPILLLRGESTALALRVFAATLGAFLICGTLNFFLLFRNGESISKRIMGIRIANLDGSRTPLWRILILRNGVYTALFAALGFTAAVWQGFVSGVALPPDFGLRLSIALGVFFILDSCLVFGKSRRTLHDRIAGTIVVET